MNSIVQANRLFRQGSLPLKLVADIISSLLLRLMTFSLIRLFPELITPSRPSLLFDTHSCWRSQHCLATTSTPSSPYLPYSSLSEMPIPMFSFVRRSSQSWRNPLLVMFVRSHFIYRPYWLTACWEAAVPPVVWLPHHPLCYCLNTNFLTDI